MQGAMQAMGSDRGSTDFLNSSIQSGAQDRLDAIEKASAWQQRGTSMFGQMGDQFNQFTAEAGKQGIQAVTSARIHEANKEAAEAALAAQQQSGIAGIAGQAIGLGLSIFSDAALKTDIAPAADQLNDVRALSERLVTYHWRDDVQLKGANKGEQQLGLIAQEAEAISPLLTGSVSLDGTDGPTTVKTIRLDALVMKLLGAVGELAAQVEALEERLAQPAV